MEWTDTHLGLSDNLNSDLPWSVINVPTTLLQAISFLLCQCLMLASVRIKQYAFWWFDLWTKLGWNITFVLEKVLLKNHIKQAKKCFCSWLLLLSSVVVLFVFWKKFKGFYFVYCLEKWIVISLLNLAPNAFLTARSSFIFCLTGAFNHQCYFIIIETL